MAARLIIEEGVLKGSVFTLEEDRDRWIIGRDPNECQIVLQDSSISQQHVLLSRIPEGILIENLSQTNPTRINGEEMSLLPRLLEEGNTIQIGNEILRYHSTESGSHLNQTKETEVTAPEQTIEEIETKKSRTSPPFPFEEEASEQDEAFLEEEIEPPTLAKINFSLIESGRWLLKVISGPNTGAEFHMEAGRSYVLGTDSNHSDVVFQDTSVSRQHARITINPDDTLFIEDLNSRNGVIIEDVRIEGKQPLPINTIISLGTTSLAVYDREGEMHTIISPLLPSLLKSIQKESTKAPEKEGKQKEASLQASVAPIEAHPSSAEPKPKPFFNLNSLMIFSGVLGFLALVGFGMSSLFHTQPIEVNQPQVNVEESLQQALQPFPAIRYVFNPVNGKLVLEGHIQTPIEKNLLFSRLQGLNQYIKSVDDSGIVIDEYAWRETNAILADNPAWKDISIHSPAAGQFVASGSLKTRKQAEQLSNYLSLHFPYADRLEQEIIVEEDVVNDIHQILQKHHLSHLSAEIKNAEVVLTGEAAENQKQEIQKAFDEINQIQSIRSVHNKIQFLGEAPEVGVINITDRYHVTGESRMGDKYTVVINGRIVSEGDTLDGMEITKITPDHVFLKNVEGQYRIDY